MTSKKNIELWKQLLIDFRNSNMTLIAWCRLTGIKRATMNYRVRKLKSMNIEIESFENENIQVVNIEDVSIEGEANTSWVSVSFQSEPSQPLSSDSLSLQPQPCKSSSPSSSITLKLGDFVLDIASDFDKNVLTEVLKVVMQLC